jgi:hypothetical protein
MSQESVNDICDKNNYQKLPEDFEGWTTTAPKAGFHGN